MNTVTVKFNTLRKMLNLCWVIRIILPFWNNILSDEKNPNSLEVGEVGNFAIDLPWIVTDIIRNAMRLAMRNEMENHWDFLYALQMSLLKTIVLWRNKQWKVYDCWMVFSVWYHIACTTRYRTLILVFVIKIIYQS